MYIGGVFRSVLVTYVLLPGIY